ncbi:UDP-N-acetylmuramate dehydrogenase [Actinomyces howellii]|uniref:UDP-N-acetylenolpyruvoylglucosamine reductase n=1 Tax=Actinomyces howellii TaxID=52771 RepID=A0A448HG90_9ACTO|nr:UDP-N-acetylmuramate dehydrogenase [Actinomyces howellii]VEG27772.1 UDP-N-acetylenolpyruvoylglucosamine reductase [Actinomyces howellii]
MTDTSGPSERAEPPSCSAAPRSADPWPAPVEALAHRPGTQEAPTTLAELTTLRVGGPVGEYVEARTEAELIDAVRQADDSGTPLLVVGGGSNIVASDTGFPGRVLRDARQEVLLVADNSCGGVEFTATAGTTWDDLVREAVASHWGGFAPLSGIPGTVGAAPVQNIGAYGAEVCQLLASVRAWDRAAGRTVHLALSELGLGYRDSDLKRSLSDAEIGAGRTWGPTGRWVVLSVTFLVRPASLSAPIAYSQLARELDVELGTRVDARAVREAVLDLRRSKGMVLDTTDHDTWSAGSFFTNPVLPASLAAALPADAPRYPVAARAGANRPAGAVRPEREQDAPVKTSAAWLIDHAGFPKGFTLSATSRVSLSTKHVLALTNRGGARAQEVAALRDAVVAGVRDRFGIALVPEPVHVGW